MARRAVPAAKGKVADAGSRTRTPSPPSSGRRATRGSASCAWNLSLPVIPSKGSRSRPEPGWGRMRHPRTGHQRPTGDPIRACCALRPERDRPIGASDRTELHKAASCTYERGPHCSTRWKSMQVPCHASLGGQGSPSAVRGQAIKVPQGIPITLARLGLWTRPGAFDSPHRSPERPAGNFSLSASPCVPGAPSRSSLLPSGRRLPQDKTRTWSVSVSSYRSVESS